MQDLYAIYKLHPVISKDTRDIPEGCIYWALRGERFDGNAFAEEALAKGAAYAVIDDPQYKKDDRYILVDDSLRSLQALATYHRRQLGIPVIAIAGSNGKTTTKELISRVLSKKYRCFSTPGNLNNHIGLPLSLLMIKESTEIAVLELGANHQGENHFLCTLCLPDYGMITNIGKDHLEGFGGMEGVEKANAELFDNLRAHGGRGFVNRDDERVMRNVKGLNSIYYGAHPDADIMGEVTERFPFLTARVFGGCREMIIQSHLFGAFNLYNILAAATIGLNFNVTEEDIKEAIESYVPANNRSQLVRKGSNTIIMDAYNANPSSMQGAIADFSDYPGANKALLLGDMFELGEDSPAEHRAILEMIDPEKFKTVALSGPAFYSFRNNFPFLFFENTQRLSEWLHNQLFTDTVFYIKGSRGMKMESTLDTL